MKSLTFTWLACVAVACAGPARDVAPPAATPSASPAPLTAPATAATLGWSNRAVLRLGSDPDAEGRVLVELHLEGPLASVRSLVFRPAHDARIEEVSARDSSGAIETRAVAEGSLTRIGLARAGALGTLDVRYRVAFGAKGDAYSPYAEPIELSFGGEDVLALPETDDRFPMELHLKTGRVASGGASSFAIGNVQQVKSTSMKELRHAWFVAGDVGTAVFHGADGDDNGAWIGFTAFDPRWVSAELAGIRSAVDNYVGRAIMPDAPPSSFLFTVTHRDDPPLLVTARTRGLVVSVDRRASWGPAVRVLATQALVRRYVGGFLWVGDRNDEASGAFFSDGFSRAIARELLFDASWLPALDRATELNTLLAAIAFTTDPRGLATARGALVATALDVALRKGSDGKGSLKNFIRESLARAAKDSKDTISYPDFMASVRASAGDAAAREMEAGLHQNAEVKLPSDLAGPCFRLVQKQLVQFELGLVTSSADVMKVESVKAGSRAEAAGVRAGDVVREIHYEQGHSAVPVKMLVERQERKVRLQFLPAGAAKPGRQYERVAGIPDDRC